MSKQNVHVVPNNGRWEVRLVGSNAPVSSHQTQTAAAQAGRPIAQINQSELVIHRPNGQIRDRDSFGPDPFPPRDTRH